MPHKKRDHFEDCIFRLQFASLQELKDSIPFTVEDEFGGQSRIDKRGDDYSNYKYNFKSIGFSENISKVIQEEKIPHVRQTPLQSVKGTDQVSIRSSKYEKFTPISKRTVDIFSFEKSVYQTLSRDMMNFISGIKSFNNIIGEPVNKYRKNYKLLNHVRENYFSNVLSEPDFEKYLKYYKFIDSAVGVLLSQMIPASAFSNTGIEDVVESHALERNKYDHKHVRIERKEPVLETNILGINEMLYDWEHGHFSSNEDEHCLWQKDRKKRNTADRESIRKVLTTVVTGSGIKMARNYVLRNLVRPYKYSTDRSVNLSLGHNRKANKIKDLYKIINTGKQIIINSEDIYEFKKCDDILDPQQEKIYTVKTNTTDTDGYLDADSDLILPLTFYSSSVGIDFYNFKQNLKITNNLEMPESISSVASLLFDHGPAHRRVKLGTPPENRPEAYEISSSSQRLVFKQPSSGPRSLFHKGQMGNRLYRLSNIKTKISDTEVLVQGNYSKDYEIVMTNGRHQNNNYLVENEGKGLTGSLVPSAMVGEIADFLVPTRTKREHVIVNRFSPIGSPETSGKYGLDRVSEEHSIYSTINYRNSLVRGVYDTLSKEHSYQFGIRSVAPTASVHKTNRNYRRFVSGPVSPSSTITNHQRGDNYFLQHEIPQNDFGYSWITASVDETVYSFLRKNENTGHQHLMNISGSLKSSETILFLSASKLGTDQQPTARLYAREEEISLQPWRPVDFVGLNDIIYEPVTASANQLGFPLGTFFGNPDASPNNRGIISPADGGYYEYYYNNDTLGMLNSNANALGLNSLILKRQGPYGWPTWKQTRASHNPIVRNHRRNNILSAVFRGATPFPSCYAGSQFEYQNTKENGNTIFKPREVKNYDEILATCKFNPITVTRHTHRTESGIEFLLDGVRLPPIVPQWALALMWWNDEFLHEFLTKTESLRTALQLPSISMRVPLQNTVTAFANQDMADDLYYEENSILNTSNIDIINSFIKEQSTAPDSSFLEVNYIETVYPREINTFTKEARNRELYDFFGWDSTRDNRSLLLTGNINYGNFKFNEEGIAEISFEPLGFLASETATTQEEDFNKSLFNSYEALDYIHRVNFANASGYTPVIHNIKTSKWVLDSRKDYSSTPTDITVQRGWLNNLLQRERADMETGLLQNEFSMYPLGGNQLRGMPGFAPVYNRRVPQLYVSSSTKTTYLAGEAEWTAGFKEIGPFYDEYKDFQEEVKLVGQQYSLIPEFTISRYIEDIYSSGSDSSPTVGDDFLQLTGAVYHSSSGEVSIGTQFFKTYSNSDFMKYFQPFKDNMLENGFDMSAGKLSLRCSAVKRLLPYRGFYPAERTVQISEIFHDNYLKSGSYNPEYIPNSLYSEEEANKILRIKINNTKRQVSKPLLAPGVLFNSIKAGLAVDYPLFSSSATPIRNFFFNDSTGTYYTPENLPGSATSALSYTGSLINNTIDSGIPRLKGPVDRRVTFEDLLNPIRLFGQKIFENEPHSSASILYGSKMHYAAREDEPLFGSLDTEFTRIGNGINFNQNFLASVNSLKGYTSAIHNFTSETVRFFLEDEKLQTVSSLPAKPLLQSDTTYRMRVYLHNKNTVMYDRHSAFGPPVDDGNPTFESYSTEGTAGTKASGSITFTATDQAAVAFSGDQILYGIYATQMQKVPTDMQAIDLNNAVGTYPTSALPGFKVSGYPSGSGKNLELKYYDRNNYSSSYSQIRFQNPASYSSIVTNKLSGSLTNPYGIIVTLSSQTIGAGASAIIGYYDSKTSDSYWSTLVQSQVGNVEGSGPDGAMAAGGTWVPLIDVSGTTGGFKTAQELAFKTQRTINNNYNTYYDCTSSLGTCSVFVKSNRRQALDWTIATASSQSGVLSVTGSGAGALANVFDYDGGGGLSGSFFRFNPFVVKVNLGGTNQTIEEYATAQENNSDTNVGNGTSKTYMRFFDVANAAFAYQGGAFHSGVTLASASSDIINELSSEINITSSQAALDLTKPRLSVLAMSSSVTGSGANTTIEKLNSFGTSVIHTASANSLAGGTDATTEPSLVKTETTVSGSHGYLPYVPPFLDPMTAPYAQIDFTPSETREYTVPEIINNMSVSYYNMEAPSNSATNTNFKEAMVLSASINFDNSVLLYSDNYVHLGSDPRKERIVNNPNPDLYRWVIQPKWETPILDFSREPVTTLNLSSNKVETVADSPWKTRYQTEYYAETRPKAKFPYLTSSTGIWHQRGYPTVTDANRGYYLTVIGASTRVGKTEQIDNLAEKVGFVEGFAQRPTSGAQTYLPPQTAQPFKTVELGRIAKEKIISEAVIAIPYYLEDDCEMKFLPMDEKIYDLALKRNVTARDEYIELLRSAASEQERVNVRDEYEKFYESTGLHSVESAAYQMRMMDKYILPPQFDFLKNPDQIDPYVAYVFQFKAKLTRDDLADIWQNMYPTSGKGISIAGHSDVLKDQKVSDVEYITHIMNDSSAPFLKGNPSIFEDPSIFMDNDIRWLVFKIKYRAECHYSNVIQDSITDIQEDIMEISESRVFNTNKMYGKQEKESETDKALFSKYSYNWPYDFFSIVEMIKLETKVDFLSDASSVATATTPVRTAGSLSLPDEIPSTIPAVDFNYAGGTGIAESVDAAILDNIVFRQALKEVEDPLPSVTNTLTISPGTGKKVKSGSETIYLNGQLLNPGTSRDYTISGNTVVFNVDLQDDDNVLVSFVRE